MRLNRVHIIDNSKLINKLILTSLGTLGLVLGNGLHPVRHWKLTERLLLLLVYSEQFSLTLRIIPDESYLSMSILEILQ